MLDLLKADLYRMSRPARLHGYLWKALMISFGVTVLTTALMLMMPLLMQGASGSAGADLRVDREVKALQEIVASPSALIGSALLPKSGGVGMFPLIACFGMIISCLSDFNRGFATSFTASRRGRLGYLAEKVVLAGIWSAIVLAFMAGTVVCTVLVLGKRFTSPDPIGDLALWMLCCWLCTWALTVISIALAAITRSAPAAYFGTVLIMMAVIPNLIALVSQLAGGVNALTPVADALRELVNWFPSQCSVVLKNGIGALSQSAGGAATSFPGGFAGQAALVGLAWVVGAGACMLLWARHREI